MRTGGGAGVASRCDTRCRYLGGSGGVVVFPVQFVLFRARSARQQDIHVKIVVWFFSTRPVLSYCLVNNYGSLEGGGAVALKK